MAEASPWPAPVHVEVSFSSGLMLALKDLDIFLSAPLGIRRSCVLPKLACARTPIPVSMGNIIIPAMTPPIKTFIMFAS